MQQKMLAHMPPAERLQTLKDNADKIEQGEYVKRLSIEELDQRREKLSENEIILSELQEELKELRERIKGETKPIIEQKKTLLKEIKTLCLYL